MRYTLQTRANKHINYAHHFPVFMVSIFMHCTRSNLVATPCRFLQIIEYKPDPEDQVRKQKTEKNTNGYGDIQRPPNGTDSENNHN